MLLFKVTWVGSRCQKDSAHIWAIATKRMISCAVGLLLRGTLTTAYLDDLIEDAARCHDWLDAMEHARKSGAKDGKVPRSNMDRRLNRIRIRILRSRRESNDKNPT